MPGQLPLPVRCSTAVKPPTRQHRTYICEFHCTLEDGTPELTSGFWEPRNEMWGWYTAWDEICDRDRDRTAVTKDIHPCLTASHWHNVAWNTAQPALFAGGSALTAKSPPYIFTQTSWNYSTCSTVRLPECKAGVLWPDCKLQLNYRGSIYLFIFHNKKALSRKLKG